MPRNHLHHCSRGGPHFCQSFSQPEAHRPSHETHDVFTTPQMQALSTMPPFVRACWITGTAHFAMHPVFSFLAYLAADVRVARGQLQGPSCSRGAQRGRISMRTPPKFLDIAFQPWCPQGGIAPTPWQLTSSGRNNLGSSGFQQEAGRLPAVSFVSCIWRGYRHQAMRGRWLTGVRGSGVPPAGSSTNKVSQGTEESWGRSGDRHSLRGPGASLPRGPCPSAAPAQPRAVWLYGCLKTSICHGASLPAMDEVSRHGA